MPRSCRAHAARARQSEGDEIRADSHPNDPIEAPLGGVTPFGGGASARDCTLAAGSAGRSGRGTQTKRETARLSDTIGWE